MSKICEKGLWDNSIPDLTFDGEGVSNYAKIQDALMSAFPRGENGEEKWLEIIDQVKKNRRGDYDCIVGISGGVDSSYLLYLITEKYGLRPLAVTLDNGWSSEIAVENIKKLTESLGVDLYTHVIDYEEIKDLLRSYMFSGLPWIDTPTDSAIKALMYKAAREFGVKYIFRGNDFRSEGKQPLDWTYSDNKQLKHVHRSYGKIKKLRTYPYLTLRSIIVNSLVYKIKDIRPFYYLDYNKSEARDFLEKNFNWVYYGGHHHENLFTKFVMSYWLPKKFGIDKRKISLSAQVMSGFISRKEALEQIEKQPMDEREFIKMKPYILSKLELTEAEFELIWSGENKTYRDYPSNLSIILYLRRKFGWIIKIIFQQVPMTFIALDTDKK